MSYFNREALKYASESDNVVSNENIIEVNGVKYIHIEMPKVSPKMAQMILMARMMSVGHGKLKQSQRPDVDIVSEFKLIQQKKSNLPRNQRDWVVSQFHSMYKEIK